MAEVSKQTVGLEPLTREQAPEKSQAIFDNIEKGMGRVPNLFRIQGISAAAFGGMVGLSGELGTGTFKGLAGEAIALAVAEANGCGYCQAAHTAVAQMQGASEEETIALRQGKSQDPKLAAHTTLAREITLTRGRPSEEAVKAFYDAGYDKAALVELVAWVARHSFNNYLGRLSDVEVDFPAAPAIS